MKDYKSRKLSEGVAISVPFLNKLGLSSILLHLNLGLRVVLLLWWTRFFLADEGVDQVNNSDNANAANKNRKNDDQYDQVSIASAH